MVQSVELLPDPAVEGWVRAQWQALVEAGLPSLGHHQGPTNRPHVTLGVASGAGPDHEDRLREALAGVAWREALVRPGGFVVFGPQGRSGRFVLARHVVVSPALLRLHAAVAGAWADADGVPETVRVGRWTPHLTLALRLTADEVARALEVTGAVPRPGAEPSAPLAVRRWDGDARREWTVTGRDA